MPDVLGNPLRIASNLFVVIPRQPRACRQVVLIAALAAASTIGPRATIFGQEEKPRDDNPGAAAVYQQQLLVDANGEIPLGAAGSARERIERLRLAVAERARVPALALAKGATRGMSVRVGGIPVGPLPLVSPARQPFLAIDAIRRLPPQTQERLQQEAQPLVLPLSVTLNPQDWIWLGPDHVGGRTRAIVVHPDNPHRMWLAGISGGIWRTDDGGNSWSPMNDFMANLVVSCMVLDPTNPDVLYAGTGEGFFNAFALRGFGVFKSIDGGLTWTHLAASATQHFRWVNRLAMSADGRVLLVVTGLGLFRSTDGGATLVPASPPIVAGTDNELLDVRFHPTDSLKCLAAGRRGKVLVSSDGGQTWTAAQGIPTQGVPRDGRVELAYAAADPDIVYASVDYGQGELYRSSDGGLQFALHSRPGHLRGQGWYNNTIWAGDKSDANLLLIGGIDLFRSTDGGRRFARISDWTQSASLHADQHVIVAHSAYDRNNNRMIFVGNDGGIYRTRDILAPVPQWTTLNNGLGITQFYGAAGNTQTGEIIGGTQDNGTLLSTPSSGQHAFRRVLEGDGGFAAADSISNIFFGEASYLRLYRFIPGRSAVSITAGLSDAGRESDAMFVAPFILDPNNRNVLLAGGSRLWRTNQAVGPGVPSWSVIKSFSSTDKRISAIAVAKGESNMVWVGHEGAHTGGSGAVYRTADGNEARPTWTRVGQNVLPQRLCTRLIIDPADRRRVFAAFSGYAADNLWVTADDGANWQRVGPGVLPEVPVYDLAIHPQNPDVWIVGTEVGLLVSADRGTTWYPTNHGPTNCAVFQLFWMDTTLVVATHGRGLFQINLGRNPAAFSTRALESLPRE